MKKPLLIIILILVADQVLKFWVKTHMWSGQDYHLSDMMGIGDWFILHFTENKGMAFGITWGGRMGKLVLSIFRIVAVGAIGMYLYSRIKNGAHAGFIVSISLIFAGAMGNILDSAFYGLIFSESERVGQIAMLFPAAGGYDSFLFGSVVDMLYFPVIDTQWPSWVPEWGGQTFIFFRPVFNIADSAITTGILTILFFQRKHFDL